MMKEVKNILIVDDESVARSNIRSIIEQYCPGFEVIAECESVVSALKIIPEINPDIVLLDIEMPGGNGFELLDYLTQKDFSVIFITAYNQYAIKAFKYSAIDYLLKPVDIGELISALDKAKQNQDGKSDKKINYRDILEVFDDNSSFKLAIHTTTDTELIPIKEIIRMEASGNYTEIFLKSGRKILASKLLKEYEELLSDANFFRTHHSHLINMNYVKKYIKKDGFSVVLDDGSHVPLAVRRKEIFEKLLKKISR